MTASRSVTRCVVTRRFGALLALDADRTAVGFPPAPPFNCTWADAMGDEQAAWAAARGWVGSDIQLACGPYGPLRIHVRLFREGGLTLGGAHLDLLVPGTARHEAIAWEFPEQFVMVDMLRTGLLTQPPSTVLLSDLGGSFRAVPYLLYNGLPTELRALLGFTQPVPQTVDVPIPTDGVAGVFAVNAPFDSIQDKRRDEMTIVYDQFFPKPFCSAGPLDWVYAQGPVRLAQTVHTTPSGAYSRVHTISGVLNITPFNPVIQTFTDPSVQAVVSEYHRGFITDHNSETRWIGVQTLLGQPLQSSSWSFSAGRNDGYTASVECGPSPQ